MNITNVNEKKENIMEKMKVLKLVHPFVEHAPNNTRLWSMLLTEPKAYSWIMNNFIVTCMRSDGDDDNFFSYEYWFDCPFLDSSKISRELLKTLMDCKFTDYIERAIDKNYYIYTFLNVKYIAAYKKTINVDYNPFIYGYDKEARIIYLADFFDNRKFAFKTCTYDEINQAFEKYDDSTYSDRYVSTHLYIMKNNITWKFNKGQVIRQLKYCLDSTMLFEATSDRLQEDYYFGLKMYDLLISLIKSNENLNISRPLHLINTKFVLMNRRLHYLYENGYIPDLDPLLVENNELEKLSLMLCNRYIKEIEMKSSLTHKLSDMLKALQVKEEKFIIHLISILESDS